MVGAMNHDREYKEDIRFRIQERMVYMTSYARTLFFRIDVRFPQGYNHDGENREISYFFKLFSKRLAYHGVRFQYVWVRERVTSDAPHYHCVIWVDGSCHHSPYGFYGMTEQIWKQVLGPEYHNCDGLIHHCEKDYWGNPVINGILIEKPLRNAGGDDPISQRLAFDASVALAFERADYLAKLDSKDSVYRGRTYGYSEIEPR